MPQVVHGRQVVLPQVVQYPQQHLLLEGAQGFGAGQLFLLVVGGDDLLEDLATQGFLVQLVVFVQPLLDRQAHGEVAVQRGLQAFDVPLLGQRLRGMCWLMVALRVSSRNSLMVSPTSSADSRVLRMW